MYVLTSSVLIRNRHNFYEYIWLIKNKQLYLTNHKQADGLAKVEEQIITA